MDVFYQNYFKTKTHPSLKLRRVVRQKGEQKIATKMTIREGVEQSTPNSVVRTLCHRQRSDPYRW